MNRISSIEPLSESARLLIRNELNAEVTIIDRSTLETRTPQEETTALICRDRDRWDEIFRIFPNLKFVFIVSVGVEKLPFEILLEKSVQVANPRGVNAPIISDYVMGAILSHSTRIIENRDNQNMLYWKKFQCVDSLEGQTVLIVGAGKIGQLLARKAKVFGMKCVGVKNHIHPLENFDQVVPLDTMKEFLPMADYIVASIPLTPDTTNLFNRETFAQMKKSAYFVNISRGGLVNELDLLDALEDGVIAGATLDVFCKEPLDVHSPLWSAKNLVVTPHSSGRIENFVDRTIPYFIENYRSYINGEPLPNNVNLKDGY